MQADFLPCAYISLPQWRFIHICVMKKFTKNILCMNAESSAYEGGTDACRLAQGCKFRILASLRVFWAKRHHI